jgi:glycosyltransferase involved in cell wall biosynthesis
MNVYVYPWSTKATGDRGNPYIRNFITSLGPHCNVVNREQPTSCGLFGVAPWLRELDVLILHWAEDLPDKRGALAQTAWLRALLLAKSRLGLRVVHVLHDRVSHFGTRLQWKRRIVRALLNHADLVLTHARDGVAFARENCPEIGDRVQYLPHPVDRSTTFASGTEPFESRRYDILVWGAIVAYKGLADLVGFLNGHGLERRYQIRVAGQFPDAASYEALSRTAPYITVENRYIPDAELQAVMGESKIILLPYRPESLLASATLMTSLLSDAIVIGPDAGAFRDCAELGLISTFGELSELPDVIARALVSDRQAMIRKRRAFAAQNTWDQFARAFAAMLGT